MASKRRNTSHQNKKQEMTEIGIVIPISQLNRAMSRKISQESVGFIMEDQTLDQSATLLRATGRSSRSPTPNLVPKMRVRNYVDHMKKIRGPYNLNGRHKWPSTPRGTAFVLFWTLYDALNVIG
ncbi:hypothetical protein AAG570_005081 [Ranatra chinensis]|uniref:Uncharacterized protein n=1 Tax=Ranatra chinensis TaxID=642074 RepID=A0ABD0YL72_9HEMI